ncbi:MAG: hypothetical protein KUG77_28785 [Nannocystaceae bacterium]|nr:hypothetical protein [Nannocystaceae bacterium]
MVASLVAVHVGPIVWSLAFALPVVGLLLGYRRRLLGREARAHRALEQARLAIASAQVEHAWRHLDKAFIADTNLSPAEATSNRAVLHQLQRLLNPDLAKPVARTLRPLDHAYAQIEAGHRGDTALSRASVVQLLIGTRGDANLAVLAVLDTPVAQLPDTIEVMPAAAIAG